MKNARRSRPRHIGRLEWRWCWRSYICNNVRASACNVSRSACCCTTETQLVFRKNDVAKQGYHLIQEFSTSASQQFVLVPWLSAMEGSGAGPDDLPELLRAAAGPADQQASSQVLTLWCRMYTWACGGL